MKFIRIIFALLIGYSSITYADQNDFKSQYSKQIEIKIYSSTIKGVVKEEPFRCRPEICCFSEKFYCFMEKGKCTCDLHICTEWPNEADTKSYWMEITGTEAEKYCGRARLLHSLTNLCLCDPNKNPPCDECNPPCKQYAPHSKEGSSVPRDCRFY